MNTNKWSTGYLTPEGNLMKDELDLLSDEEIKNKAIEKEIKLLDKEKKNYLKKN